MKLLYILTLVLSMSLDSNATELRAITTNELQCSLRNTEKLSIGFDVDDTVLFSSPGFYYYGNRLCQGNLQECKTRPDFQYAINNKVDYYSLPKHIAFKLINLHQDRGDTIYFITGRHETKEEILSSLLKEKFKIKKMHDVIFTGGDNKTQAIRKHNIKIYYGDADTDMKSALEAQARAIRVCRAKNSLNGSEVNLGMFDEEILLNSEA